MEILIDKFKFLGDVRLKKAEYKESKDSLLVSLLIKNKLKENEKKQLIDFFKAEFNVAEVELVISYGLIDQRAILNVIDELLKTRFIACNAFLIDAKINLKDITKPEISFKFRDDGKELVSSSGFVFELKKELSLNFFEEFEINICFAYEKLDENVIEQLKEKWVKKWNEDQPQIKWIHVFGVKELVGNLNLKRVRRICDLNEKSGEVAICGSIKFFNERTFKKLNRKTKQQEDKTFFTFKVFDGTETLSCSWFVTKSNLKKAKKLSDGAKVLMLGDMDVYNEKLSFKPKYVSLIESFKEIKVEEVKTVYRDEDKNYKLIKPSKYEEFFEVDFEYKEEVISDKLKGKTFVALDLETTGLKAEQSEICEIAGVKIVDGIIVEQWSTLVKPVKYTVTRESEEVNHISVAMVENAPSFKQVVGDLFKWTREAIIVCQNVGFDIPFLNYYAKEQGYFFDNETIDTIVLAKTGLGGRLRNNKLSSLCAYFGIENEEAHRALSDAIATAKVFIKLANFIECPKVL